MGILDSAAGGAASGGVTGPWGAVAGAGIGAVSSMFGSKGSNNAATQAAQLQYNAAQQAAALQAKAAQDALLWSKQQDALNREEWQKTQDTNAAQWQSEYDYTKQLEAARQQRLAPYQGLGIGALGQINQAPAGIGVMPTKPGSIASLMGT
jgi:hypothetical protein